jgi:hypothetical protein
MVYGCAAFEKAEVTLAIIETEIFKERLGLQDNKRNRAS